MKANRRQQLRFSLLVIFVLTGTIAVRAQTPDCQGTLRAWEADANLREYAATCTCVGQNSQPTCTPRRRVQRPEPAANPGNPGTGEATIDNSGADDAARAEAERKRREEEFKRQQEKLKRSLKTGNSGNSQNLGLKPSSAIIREQTIKRIKELNCSAYWALQAVDVPLKTRSVVTANLEDEYTLTRQYAEFSAQAKEGKLVQGCPEVKISVPDVPPPLASNPEIQFYDQLIDEAQNLLPKIIDTNQTIRVTAKRITEAEQAKESKAQELTRISRKLNTPKNRADKKKAEAELDELMELARQAQRDAAELERTADDQSNRAKELQTKLGSRL